MKYLVKHPSKNKRVIKDLYVLDPQLSTLTTDEKEAYHFSSEEEAQQWISSFQPSFPTWLFLICEPCNE